MAQANLLRVFKRAIRTKPRVFRAQHSACRYYHARGLPVIKRTSLKPFARSRCVMARKQAMYSWSKSPFSTASTIGDIEPLELDKKRRAASGGKATHLIIDVREPHELENNNNLGSKFSDWINVPKGDILNVSDKTAFAELLRKNGVQDVNEYTELYFSCRSGKRSMDAAQHVRQLDIAPPIFNVTGGITKYEQDVGLDTVF